ncbi:MAG: AEC family transporter, partial [Armatimonadota bacterium]|nr:AEC family transporter [Armatimonadota bacterium]
AGVLGLGGLVGLVTAPLFARREQRRTFVFLVAFTNYVYLPLPIAEGLFGDAGVQAILLCNVGGQLVFWSLGPWILQGRLSGRQLGRQLALNPGLLATAAGIVVALWVPGAGAWEKVSAGEASAGAFLAGAVVQALAMLGSLTVPLSLLVIGARLAELAARAGRPSKALVGVLLSRLVLTPALTVALVWVLGLAGWPLPEVARMSTYLISAMAVGFTCMMFAERFGGDVHLTAQSIFYTTFFSLLTAPGLFAAVRWLGL